jgi:hypothetical protein
MGYNDHDFEAAYVQICIRAEAVEGCRYHADSLIRLFDDDAERRAYAIATNEWKAGNLVGEREEIMEAVKQVLDSAEDECPSCANGYSPSRG